MVCDDVTVPDVLDHLSNTYIPMVCGAVIVFDPTVRTLPDAETDVPDGTVTELHDAIPDGLVSKDMVTLLDWK